MRLILSLKMQNNEDEFIIVARQKIYIQVLITIKVNQENILLKLLSEQ